MVVLLHRSHQLDVVDIYCRAIFIAVLEVETHLAATGYTLPASMSLSGTDTGARGHSCGSEQLYDAGR